MANFTLGLLVIGEVPAAWATRLATFLFYRVLHTGHDARLDAQLATAGGAVGFWAVSFLWGVVASAPHALGAPASGSVWRWASINDVQRSRSHARGGVPCDPDAIQAVGGSCAAGSPHAVRHRQRW